MENNASAYPRRYQTTRVTVTATGTPTVQRPRLSDAPLRTQRSEKSKMSLRMSYGDVGNGLPQSTVDVICSADYSPLLCLRRSHILDINVDPSALGKYKTKQEVVPVTDIDEWLDLFMIYATVRARRFPMEGHQLVSYMKHVETNAHRKGSAIEYEVQFRLQRLPCYNCGSLPESPSIQHGFLASHLGLVPKRIQGNIVAFMT